MPKAFKLGIKGSNAAPTRIDMKSIAGARKAAKTGIGKPVTKRRNASPNRAKFGPIYNLTA